MMKYFQHLINNKAIQKKPSNTFPTSNHSSLSYASSNNSSQEEKSSDVSNSEDFGSQKKRKLFIKEEDKLLTSAAMTFKYELWNKIAMFVPRKTPHIHNKYKMVLRYIYKFLIPYHL